MASIRQEKVANLIQKELAELFRTESRTLCDGAMVSVTVVRVTRDLGIAKAYISIFGHKNPQEVYENLMDNKQHIRYAVAQKISKQIRRTPEIQLFIDDSLDYAEEIDKLLKS